MPGGEGTAFLPTSPPPALSSAHREPSHHSTLLKAVGPLVRRSRCERVGAEESSCPGAHGLFRPLPSLPYGAFTRTLLYALICHAKYLSYPTARTDLPNRWEHFNRDFNVLILRLQGFFLYFEQHFFPGFHRFPPACLPPSLGRGVWRFCLCLCVC